MKKETLNFNSDSIARAYDNILVPTLFSPWAKLLIKDFTTLTNETIIDLATGTGIVT